MNFDFDMGLFEVMEIIWLDWFFFLDLGGYMWEVFIFFCFFGVSILGRG